MSYFINLAKKAYNYINDAIFSNNKKEAKLKELQKIYDAEVKEQELLENLSRLHQERKDKLIRKILRLNPNQANLTNYTEENLKKLLQSIEQSLRTYIYEVQYQTVLYGKKNKRDYGIAKAAIYDANKRLVNGWQVYYPASEGSGFTNFPVQSPPSTFSKANFYLQYFSKDNATRNIEVKLPTTRTRQYTQRVLKSKMLQAFNNGSISTVFNEVYVILVSYKLLTGVDAANAYADLNTVLLSTPIDDNYCVPKTLINHKLFDSMVRRQRNQTDTQYYNRKVEKWKSIFTIDDINKPYTLDECIKKIFVPYDWQVVIYDTTGNIIYKNISDKKNTLVCMLSDGHLYEDLPTCEQRTDILRRCRDNSTISLNKEKNYIICKVCKLEFKNKSKLIEHLYIHNLVTEYPDTNGSIVKCSPIQMKQLIEEKHNDYPGSIYNIKFSEDKKMISEFSIRPSLIRLPNSIVEKKTYINTHTIPSGLQIEFNDIVDTNYNFKSTFNKLTQKVFEGNIPKSLIKTFNKVVGGKKIYQCDKEKAYSSICENYKIPKYTKLDCVEVYNGEYNDCGFYYIEAYIEEYGIHDGWLCIPFVNQLIKWKYDVKITHQLIPTSYVVLKSMIKGLYELHGNNIKEWNKVVGCNRHTESKYDIKYGITSDPKEIGYFKSLYNSNYEHIYETDDKVYCLVSSYKRRHLDFTGVPLYLMCVQLTTMFIIDMIRQLPKDATLLAIKTDCILYHSNDDKPLNINNSMYNLEEDSILTKYITKEVDYNCMPSRTMIGTTWRTNVNNSVLNIIPNTIDCHTFDDLLDNIFNTKSFILSGLPGAGKTQMIKIICEKLDKEKKKYLILAPTNAAAGQHDIAQTLHKFFGIKIGSDCISTNLLDKFKDIDTLFIDEYAFVPPVCWNYIILIAEELNINIILTGDHKQHSYVSDNKSTYHDLYNNKIINHITNNTRYNLMYSFRIKNEEFVNYLRSVNNFDLDKLREFGVNIVDEVQDIPYNICYYNATRRYMEENYKTTLYIANESKQSIGLIKNMHYIVERDGDSKFLVPDNNISHGKSVDKIKLSSVKSLVSNSNCCTSYKYQGCTLNSKIQILDWNTKYGREREFRLVALSRCRDPEDITICTKDIYKIQLDIEKDRAEEKAKKEKSIIVEQIIIESDDVDFNSFDV